MEIPTSDQTIRLKTLLCICNKHLTQIFDKKQISKHNPLARTETLTKDFEHVSKALRNEVLAITRMRHPSIVQVVEALKEHSGVLAFATEQLQCTLSHFLQNHSASELITLYTYGGKELDELSIQIGLLQVMKGLAFLHSNLMVHVFPNLLQLCLDPDSIFVDCKGENWKIGGFVFASTLKDSEEGYCEINDPLLPYCMPQLGYFGIRIYYRSS